VAQTPVYSTRFLQEHHQTGSGMLVPVGFRAVVRELDVVNTNTFAITAWSLSTGPPASVLEDEDSNPPLVVYHHYELRVVVEAGEPISFSATNPLDFYCGGYLLVMP
jgi:hypothetical protein